MNDIDLATEFSDQTILEITGIEYLVKAKILDINHIDKWLFISRNNTDISIRVSDKNLIIKRRLDLEHKIIHNELLIIRNENLKYKGIATKILSCQIFHSYQKRINKIQLYAAGDKNSEKYNGYITWGKLGFTIEEIEGFENYNLKFTKLLKSHGRQEKTLFELLTTEEGTKFWCEFGFAWFGEFNLTNNSVNWENIIYYCIRKSNFDNITKNQILNSAILFGTHYTWVKYFANFLK